MAQRTRAATWQRFQTLTLSCGVKLCCVMLVLCCSDCTALPFGRHLLLRSEERTARDKRQSMARWSQWYNTDRPWNGEGDFETVDQIQQRQQICPFGQEVSSCQCRVTQSTDIFDCYTYNRSQVDILFQPCTKFGIICLNRQQPGGRQCQDYELRFLCTDIPDDSPGGSSYLLSFDLKVYIILAAVPLMIFALRILWFCIRRCQRKQQQRHRRESNVSDSTASSSYNEDEAFTSSLANPPPSYSDLFGQNPPQVFAISTGIVGECSLCRHRGTALVNLENPRPTSRADDSQRVIPPSGDTGDEVLAAPAPGDSPQSSQSLRTTLDRTENVPDNTPTTASPEERNTPQVDFSHFACACPCHTFQFITSGQDNPAFAADCEPKLGPGMHKPVFSFFRVDTSASFLSVTESLPDYEQALQLLNEGSQCSPLGEERRQID
ncbi:hypothetical protein C0Q70_21450 [Pomacea canaliculata]|uniref:WxxW domain-containing protein n=1 Tax=Pomacea canaliculata TaxID=400727 RepID=A0A2T7NCM5_POMCA|nr:uncharacterized protein LOC112555430 [Pomacea canaliculata]XP_025079616.1 uncharacterized protein LOC112555430 [Pomacea canaliculata]XP_025079617.1 uncharacterized protein LOC112555430 [Pomacea canaliculata]PVD18892.1 hypothetical protein C0Q70_21450 [Pomacea canaliculata]